MKTIRTLFRLLTIIFSISSLQLHAKKNDCIYRIVTDSIYNLTSHVRIATNERLPIDPTSVDTIELKYEMQEFHYSISLNSKTMDGWSPAAFVNRFDQSANSMKLKRKKFTDSNFTDLTDCNWFQTNYCIALINKDKPTDYGIVDTCKINNRYIPVTRKRFNYSSIFYSQDGKTALVILQIEDDPTINRRQIWGVVLRKHSKIWKIQRIELSSD